VSFQAIRSDLGERRFLNKINIISEFGISSVEPTMLRQSVISVLLIRKNPIISTIEVMQICIGPAVTAPFVR
jgi:hypothetical protein